MSKNTFSGARHENRYEIIAKLMKGDIFDGTVKILQKAKPGPVVFSLTDGLSIIDGVIRDSPFMVDDVVKVMGQVTEHAGRLQIEIDTISRSAMNFDKILDQRSIPVRDTFSISSSRYDQMKSGFIRLAAIIRRAIFNNQPIILRHHNDSDGISAGLALEKAIQSLMKQIGINVEHNLYRNPSLTPFYDTSDVFRDIGLSQRLTKNFNQKTPLIILCDMGTTPENLFSLKILKSFKLDCIVIDHHHPLHLEQSRPVVSPYLLDILNPHLYELDGQTSAGMLAHELARMVNEEYENPVLPAVAAISDRCNIRETDLLIDKSGRSREELQMIGIAIDYLAYQLKFDAGTGIYEKVYENSELVQNINDAVQVSVNSQLQSTMPYLQSQDINGIFYSQIDLEKYTTRFRYPTPGKVLGMIHDTIVAGKQSKSVITIGYVSDMIIIRANKPDYSVQDILEMLKEKIPEANVEGGGHEQAGTIKFIPAHLLRILELIKEQLRNIPPNE
nr:hypothetical protein [Candidatus Sigynarchaeota archaeon]